MEPDQNLRLDSSVKIRLEREWIYFKLKHKVDTCETVQLGEIKELNQLLAEIEGAMDDDCQSPGRCGHLGDSVLNELIEARRGRLATATSPASSAGDDN